MFGKTTINIVIKGMDCDHCAHTVKTALENIDGVDKVKVNLSKGEAAVTLKKADTAPEIFVICESAIKEAGFEVVNTEK